MIALVTSEGYERRLRAKRVTVVFNDTPMEEVSGMFFLTLLTSSSLWSHSLLWRKVLECSSSPCSLRHPCVLTHFVIPVISLIWRKYLECSSSHYSLRHPCVLTPMTCLLTHLIVIPDFSLESSHPSHPWLLTPITRVTTHSILSVLTHTHSHRTNPSHLTLSLPSLVLPCSLIPACSHITPTTTHSHWVFSHWVFSHPSSSLTTHSHHSSHTHSLIPAFSLTSLLWVLTPITCLLTLTISHRVSPHALSHPSHLCHHTEWSHITCVLRECLFPLLWCRTTTKCTLTLSSLSHTLPLMSSLWTLPWCRTTTKSTHSLLWEDLCSHSHSHGVVLPPSLPTHCSERTCAPTHTPMVSYYHQVYPLTLTLSSLSHTLPWCRTTTKSSHTHTNPCAPTHSHVLTHSAPLTSFHLILTTNSSQLISHTLPPIMPPSHHHHLITSSYHLSPPIASSHSTQHS